MSAHPPGGRPRWPVALALLAIGLATLFPTAPATIPLPMFCIVCGVLGGVDAVLNIALFVPLGAALAWRGVPVRRAFVWCALLSLSIESLQFSTIPGRDASLGDLLTNTLGGAIGALLVWRMDRWLHPTPRAAQRMLAVAGAAWLAVLAGSASLLRPWIPYSDYFGQWAPNQPRFAPFTGRVVDVSLNGIHIPYDVVPQRDAYLAVLRNGLTDVRAQIVTGAPTSRLSAIARLSAFDRELFLIGQTGTSMVFRTETWVNAMRLRSPAIRLDDAVPRPGERVVLEGVLSGPAWFARSIRPDTTVEWRVPFSVALGWTYLLPRDAPLRPGYRWIDAIWLALLIVPVGFLARHAAGGDGALVLRSRLAIVTVMAAFICTGLVIVPWLSGFERAHWSEWCGAVIGAIAGWLIANGEHRHRRRGETPQGDAP